MAPNHLPEADLAIENSCEIVFAFQTLEGQFRRGFSPSSRAERLVSTGKVCQEARRITLNASRMNSKGICS